MILLAFAEVKILIKNGKYMNLIKLPERSMCIQMSYVYIRIKNKLYMANSF